MNTVVQNHNAIIAWASSVLPFNVNNDLNVIVETPWSSVIKIKTTSSTVYLKQAPPELFIESAILKKLHADCGINTIPQTIAENPELHCFIMTECGDLSLRTLFNGQIDTELVIEGLRLYRHVQKATAQHLDTFLQIGVPDWRLESFPQIYNDLVSNEDFLRSEGLSDNQIKTLHGLSEQCATLCGKLASFGLPASLNHSDFHDNNILFNQTTRQLGIIDLGETTIDHPFFSLAFFLIRISARYQLAPESSAYKKLKDACFADWGLYDADMDEALAITYQLLPCYAVFAHVRLMNAAGHNVLNSVERMRHRVKHGLLKWSGSFA